MIQGRLVRLEQALAKALAPPDVVEVEVFGEDDFGAGRREGGPAVEREVQIAFGRSTIIREIMMDLTRDPPPDGSTKASFTAG